MKKKIIFLIIIICTLLMATSFDNKQRIKHIISKTDININDSMSNIFTEYESMPCFIGGEMALLEFIDKNLNKKIVENKNLTTGRCIVTFQIDTVGKCDSFKVLKSYNHEIDSEFIRVLKLMPKWNSGSVYINNTTKKIPIKYTLPLKIPYKRIYTD